MKPLRAMEWTVEAPNPATLPLRLAMVTETYPPDINGVASTLATVVAHLRERQHAVQLVRLKHPADGPLQPAADHAWGQEEVRLRGLPIPRYPDLRMGLPATGALRALWQRQRPDLVHIATEGPLGWSALRAARALKLPVVSDFRTNFHSYMDHYGLAWLRGPALAYLRKFHNRTQCTMVPNAALRDELAARGFRDLTVIGRGVDTVRFSPAWRSPALRAAWGADDATLVALYVGRLAAEKNLALWWQAVQAMRNAGRKVLPVLVGDGPARAECEAGMPGAIFAGTRRGEELAAHYASADLFVFASLTETFGNVTAEAMASGLPVVAFDHAAAGLLVEHGFNGFKAHPSDHHGFVRAAVQAMAHRAHLPAMGRHARVTACAHGWPRIVDEIEAVMRGAMRAARPLPAPRLAPMSS